MQCLACGGKLKIPASKSGKSIVCPKCNNKFKFVAPAIADEPESQRAPATPIGDKVSAGLFEEDIDDLLADVTQPVPKPEKKVRKRKQLKYRSEQASKQQPEVKEDHQAAWQQEKRVTTDREESLHRNGVGLIILATGLAMLPFFARNVEALSPALPYLPIAAIAVAFIASFMIAISLRRSNIGAILISGLPFLLICMLALVGYYFNRTQIPDEPIVAERSNEDETVKKNDNFTIDRDSVGENAATKFVPALKPKPKPVDNLVQQQPSQVEAKPVSPVAKIRESNLKPNEIAAPSRPVTGRNNQPSELERQLQQATRHANNSDKLQVLLQREKQEFQKGLISYDVVKSPDDLRDNYQLSNVAGEKTVYGIAYYSSDAINGLDVAHRSDDVDRFFDIFMPINDAGEFDDSIVPADPNTEFIGLNVVATPAGISRLQGVFQTSDNQEVLGKWIGSPAQPGSSIEKLRLQSGQVVGIVVYRNQFRVTGIRLVGSLP